MGHSILSNNTWERQVDILFDPMHTLNERYGIKKKSEYTLLSGDTHIDINRQSENVSAISHDSVTDFSH